MLRDVWCSLQWMMAGLKPWFRLRHAHKNPGVVQKSILKTFLKKNSLSAYGKKYGYEKIDGVKAFQEKTPLVTYEDLEPWINRIATGETNILTTDKVLCFEITSGSSGPKKLIPYTEHFLNEYREAVSAWIFDLFLGCPQLLGGKQYWSISPEFRTEKFTSGGLPIGIEDDTVYLCSVGKKAVTTLMAVPPQIKYHDVTAWRKETIEHLVRCSDLRLISVWSPTFLIELLKEIPANRSLKDIWPHLKLISCWTSGPAKIYNQQLKKRFPHVLIQDKGLMATEGVTTIPHRNRLRLALNSHFYEFLDQNENAYLADEIEQDKEYEVVLTTGNGFARYRTGDWIKVTEPGCVTFIGRKNISDLCGEKLNELFVLPILEEAAHRFDLGSFTILAPEFKEKGGYVLISDGQHSEGAASFIEEKLCQSFHYNYCRQLGQLDPISGLYMRNAGKIYQSICIKKGQKLGDIKPCSLHTDISLVGKFRKHSDT